MDKVLKFSVAFCLIMASSGVFYHYMIFLPGVEKARVEAAEVDKKAAEKKETDRKATYESCQQAASNTYSTQWAEACRDEMNTTEKRRATCLADRGIANNQFLGATYCKKMFPATDPSPTCALPGSRADTINGYHNASTQKCIDEAKAGL